MTHPLKTAGALSGFALSMLLASAAAAQEPVVVYADPVNSVRVSFADLDLDTVTGRSRLHGRVGAAIERVCDLELGRDGLQLPGYYACAGQAWTDASSQIAQVVERSREAALSGSPTIAITAIAVSAGR
jgi:UrcA family protein